MEAVLSLGQEEVPLSQPSRPHPVDLTVRLFDLHTKCSFAHSFDSFRYPIAHIKGIPSFDSLCKQSDEMAKLFGEYIYTFSASDRSPSSSDSASFLTGSSILESMILFLDINGQSRMQSSN